MFHRARELVDIGLLRSGGEAELEGEEVNEVKEYCLGFAFSTDRRRVVLIEKSKPKWQAGYLNGVGGKLEHGETPLGAMLREFHEEAGVLMDTEAWNKFCFMGGKDWNCTCFFTLSDYAVDGCSTRTDEPIKIVNVNSLVKERVISNLRWLIPLALDADKPQIVAHY